MLIRKQSNLPSLNQLRDIKMQELSLACKRTILGRFMCPVDGVDYWFSCDAEAQANFDKVDRAFDKGRTTEEPWTAYDENGTVVRLLLTQEKFEPVYVAHLRHIRDNVSLLRDTYMPRVMDPTVTDKSEILYIHW